MHSLIKSSHILIIIAFVFTSSMSMNVWNSATDFLKTGRLGKQTKAASSGSDTDLQEGRRLTRSPVISSDMRHSDIYNINPSMEPSDSTSGTNLRSGLSQDSQARPFIDDVGESTRQAYTLPRPSESTQEAYKPTIPGGSTRESYTLPRPSRSTQEAYKPTTSGESTRGAYTLPRPGESTRESYTLPRPGESTRESYTLPRPGESTRESYTLPTPGQSASQLYGPPNPGTNIGTGKQKVPPWGPKLNHPEGSTKGRLHQLPEPPILRTVKVPAHTDSKILSPHKTLNLDLNIAQRTEINRLPNEVSGGPVGSSSQTKAFGNRKATISPLRGDKTDSFEFQPFLHRQTDPTIDAPKHQQQLQALDFNRYSTLKGKLTHIPNFKAIQKALDDATPSTLLLAAKNAATAAEPALESLSKIAVISQRTGFVNIDEAQAASQALITFLKESASPSIRVVEESQKKPRMYIHVPNSLEALRRNPEYPEWMRSQVSRSDEMNVRENSQMAGFGKNEASKNFKSEADMLKSKMKAALENPNHLSMMKFDVRGRPAFYQEIKAGDDILNGPINTIIDKHEVIQRIYKRIESDIKLIENEPQDSLLSLRKQSEIMGWIEVLEKPRRWESLLASTRLDKLELISLERSLPEDVQKYVLDAWKKLNDRDTEAANRYVMEALPDPYKRIYKQRSNWDSEFRTLMEDQKRLTKFAEAWEPEEGIGRLKLQDWEQLLKAEEWEKDFLRVMKQFVKGYEINDPSLGWLNNLNRDLVEDKLKLVTLTPSRFPKIRNSAAQQLGMLKPHIGKDPLPLDNQYGIPGFLNGLSRS